MRNSAQRGKKYRAKLNGVLSHKQIAVHRKGFAGAAGGQVQTEIAVKNILTQHGVMVGLHHYYIVFGKKIGQLKKKYARETLETEACIEAQKWYRRGLEKLILLEILSLFMTVCEVPRGTIVMWSGLIADIPNGWALCDGTNGTPNISTRFVHGAVIEAQMHNTGGTSVHQHPFTAGAHAHFMEEGADIAAGEDYDEETDSTVTSGTTGNAGTLPPFYALAFIMKL